VLARRASTSHSSGVMSRQTDVQRPSRRAIATQLERVQTELDRLRAMFATLDARLPPECISPERIRGIIQARRRREAVIGEDVFTDPGWDILLELYAVSLGRELTTITDVCTAAAIPFTTGLRWLKQLEAAGLINRAPDPKDGRRVLLSLSRSGVQSMDKYFRGWLSGAAPV